MESLGLWLQQVWNQSEVSEVLGARFKEHNPAQPLLFCEPWGLRHLPCTGARPMGVVQWGLRQQLSCLEAPWWPSVPCARRVRG